MAIHTVEVKTLISRATRTSAPSAGDWIPVEDYIEALLTLNVYAYTGSGNIVATIQGTDSNNSPDATGDIYNLPSATITLSAVGCQPFALTNFGRYIRVSISQAAGVTSANYAVKGIFK